MHPKPLTREEDIRQNKDVAAFSYLWIASLLVYYSRKDSPFITYHAKQGIVLFLISLPIWFIPVVGQLLEFVVLAGAVMGFLNAFQGRYEDVPIAGALAKGEMTPAEALKKGWTWFMDALHKLFGGTKKNGTSAPTPPPATPHNP